MDTQERLYVHKILALAIEEGASDIHFSVGNPPFFRIQGKLFPAPNENMLTAKIIQDILSEWLDAKNRITFEEEKEVTFSFYWENRARFKAVVYQESGRSAIVLHLIPHMIKTPEELGLPKIVLMWAEKPSGLILVTGTFGSGRSTTLASLINHINFISERHVMTLEKPIEYVFIDNRSVIEQREVGRDTKTMLTGIAGILNEDVDVLMVSDMNDPQVFRSALSLAHMGRLVLGVIDASSSDEAIEKALKAIPDSDAACREFGLVLLGMVAQRIFPRIGGGNAVAFEVLVPNQALRYLIQKRNFGQLKNVIEAGRYEGMISFESSIKDLVSRGIIKPVS